MNQNIRLAQIKYLLNNFALSEMTYSDLEYHYTFELFCHEQDWLL
jgi:hypothetical protein